jgi:hypothetical protein
LVTLNETPAFTIAMKQPHLPTSKEELLQLSKRIHVRHWKSVFGDAKIAAEILYDLYVTGIPMNQVSRQDFVIMFTRRLSVFHRTNNGIQDVPVSAYDFAGILFRTIREQKQEEALVRRGIPLPPARATAIIPPKFGGLF